MQNSMMFTPWGPRAVPTGGAGFAETMGLADVIKESATLAPVGGANPSLTDFGMLHFIPALTSVDLWLGLLAAAGLTLLAARVRRYRDDRNTT